MQPSQKYVTVLTDFGMNFCHLYTIMQHQCVHRYSRCVCYPLSKDSWIICVCRTFKQGPLPVFGSNVWKVSIAAFGAAIGRVALVFTEAACPPIAGISANHWPSGSHFQLMLFTPTVKSKTNVPPLVLCGYFGSLSKIKEEAEWCYPYKSPCKMTKKKNSLWRQDVGR